MLDVEENRIGKKRYLHLPQPQVDISEMLHLATCLMNREKHYWDNRLQFLTKCFQGANI